MPSKSDWQAAFAICAAMIGAGFASGREIVSFFSCFGVASWLGAAAAASGIAALVYVVMLLAARTQSATLPALYGALMGPACQDAIHVLHGLLCFVTASAMLAAGAELGALTFPLHRSYELGLLLTLLSGIAAACSGLKTLASMGALLVILLAIYFAAMIPAGEYASESSWDALLPALPMGLIYASFNGALSGGTICLAGQRQASPLHTARLTGSMLFILISLANLAMLRAGDAVRLMILPSVALAANWDLSGYYISIAVLWLAVLSTLCAMLSSLSSQLTSAGLAKIPALLLSSAGAALLSVFGFDFLVNTVYPLLGWVCGFALVGLMLFLPGRDDPSGE